MTSHLLLVTNIGTVLVFDFFSTIQRVTFEKITNIILKTFIQAQKLKFVIRIFKDFSNVI